MIKNVLIRWRQLTLGQEITVILVVKLMAIMLLWWLFFKGQKIEVTSDSMLNAATLQATHEEKN